MISLRSLYIHLPFCAKKCRYCDFYSVPYDAALADSYLDALAKEIALCRTQGLMGDATILQTVYFGGGTPSMLSVSQLGALCALVRSNFALADDLEWTVESNPESFSAEKAAALLKAGVSRLSLGVQSLDDRELTLLGRVHSSARGLEVLRDPALASFAAIGVDLIYGLPGQTGETLFRSLRSIVELPRVSHISAYELTIAEGTPLGRHRSLLPLPHDEAVAEMTKDLWAQLAEKGFEHYEVSNFARPGFRCRHNEAYWNHDPYLGLGAAAHSYVHDRRWGNVRDIQRYITMIEDGALPREFVETIDACALATEMVFLGLRTSAGINKCEFEEKSGLFFDNFVNSEKIAGFMNRGWLVYSPPFLRPTEHGLLFADGMARELIG